ncbi:polysaccharide deacetylase family protein [Streptomyces mobaraensis]|uniref:polysaccharide deacetylase family protein n=2 Tax=Streptomyces TaxID=1883 RepID=UPI00163C07F0|nr:MULTISPECIES: polysaccharide deacetylase family protein [Streptomyces]MBC2877505.1 polysaccharide deacetylase family protein [Streptomyces sp. TYQ1024]UBI41001.1 polysaccharide deacetylase family protein [Streptomyces mobaraensis]UKW33483.1 polysaccharide deacetylase family protein [Streptomyces sp. TYQ1024]
MKETAAPGDKPTPVAPATTKPAPTTAPTLPPGKTGETPTFSHGRRDHGKHIALTFDADMTSDQGPRAAHGEHFDNPALIATLRRLKVPATLFMTGRWAEQYPDQARSIGADPLFEVANHSYSHHAFATPCYGLPPVKGGARADVEKAFAAFRRAGVQRTVPYFRFPGGCHNPSVLKELGPAKVTAVQWDVISGDAFAKRPGPVADEVLAKARPGSVVVMHCTRSAAPATEAAVRTIVPRLRERGYELVRVSDLIAKG